MAFRRGLGLRPINSRKEIFDKTDLGVAASTNTDAIVMDTLDDYAGAVNTCATGSVIKSVYIFWQGINDSVVSNIDMYIMKCPSDVFDSRPVPGITGGNNKRKYVLHEEKGIPGHVNAGAPPITFRGVIRIPRGRQRMGEGDKIFLRYRSASAANFCVKAITKVFN